MKEKIKKAISDFKFKNFPKHPRFIVVNELDFHDYPRDFDLSQGKETLKYYSYGLDLIRSMDVDRGNVLIG